MSAVDAERTRINQDVAEARADVESTWQELRTAVDGTFATIRANAEKRHAERDLKRAERRADTAEQDAADAVAFALYALDQAEYAIIDAAIARADADDLLPKS
jgi:hypothetical protein